MKKSVKKTHLRIIYLRSVHAFTIKAKIYHRQWMLLICKTRYKINNKHYSSVNAAGRFVDGSAERRTGLVKDSLTSSSTSSVIVAENNIVCLLFGQRRTWKFLNENEELNIWWQLSMLKTTFYSLITTESKWRSHI